MALALFLALAFFQGVVHSRDGGSCEHFFPSSPLPPSVLWIRARVDSSPAPGNAVQPLGLVLSLGMADNQTGLSNTFTFIDEFFGQGMSDEFVKQSIFFHQSDVPSALSTFLQAPSPANVLFSTWECFEGGWCTSFVSYFQRKGFIQSDTTTSLFELEAGQGRSATFCSGHSSSVSSAFTVERMTRTLRGSGSHRELNTEIGLKVTEAVKEKSHSVVLVEFLPNTLFADVFQLQRLTRIGRFQSADVYGDTDLERPAVHSRQAIVEVRNALEVDGNRLGFSIPLHVRYVPLSSRSHHSVYLSTPLVLVIGDDFIEPAVWGNGSSDFETVLNWPVPAGNVQDSHLVNLFTGLAAVAGVTVLTGVTCLTSFFPRKIP